MEVYLDSFDPFRTFASSRSFGCAQSLIFFGFPGHLCLLTFLRCFVSFGCFESLSVWVAIESFGSCRSLKSFGSKTIEIYVELLLLVDMPIINIRETRKT